MKTINGNLEMTKNMKFNEDLTVTGNITGCFNLTVAGNIDARNIDAGNIDARNIVAGNIDAWNIDARNIDARDIICVSRKKKTNDAKTIAYSIVTDRYNRERKEVMPIKRGAKE